MSKFENEQEMISKIAEYLEDNTNLVFWDKKTFQDCAKEILEIIVEDCPYFNDCFETAVSNGYLNDMR